MALDGLQQQHLTRMLHSLGLRPFQQALGSQAFGALAVGTKPAVSGGYQGMVQEASEDPDLAYGFTLGLVYFRYLGEETRDAWCRAIYAKLKESAQESEKNTQHLQSLMKKARIASPVEYMAMIAQVDAQKEATASSQRITDFCRTLLTKKMSTFSENSDKAVNEVETVLSNPWCMTNTEFAWAWAYEVDGPQTRLSLPRRHVSPAGEEAKVVAAEWAKAGATEATKAGIIKLAEALGLTAATIVFAPDVLIGCRSPQRSGSRWRPFRRCSATELHEG